MTISVPVCRHGFGLRRGPCPKCDAVTISEWNALSAGAWMVREQARVIGPTRVGCAVLDDEGMFHAGCNVEHRYRSHCVHAEVNALTSMVARRRRGRAVALVIAAERANFTPCGACMDWIFELGGPGALVRFSPAEGVLSAEIHRADELMPHYPS